MTVYPRCMDDDFWDSLGSVNCGSILSGEGKHSENVFPSAAEENEDTFWDNLGQDVNPDHDTNCTDDETFRDDSDNEQVYTVPVYDASSIPQEPAPKRRAYTMRKRKGRPKPTTTAAALGYEKEIARNTTAYHQLSHCCMKDSDFDAQKVEEHRKPYLEKKMVFA